MAAKACPPAPGALEVTVHLTRGSHEEQLLLEKQRFRTPAGRTVLETQTSPSDTHVHAPHLLLMELQPSVKWCLSRWNDKLFVSLNLF